MTADQTPACPTAETAVLLYPLMGNTFGLLFRVTTFGESHGTAIGCVVDGCPPRLALTEAEALAWQTPYPHLFFPLLAEEKAALANQWSARQRLVKGTSSTMAFATFSRK